MAKRKTKTKTRTRRGERPRIRLTRPAVRRVRSRASAATTLPDAEVSIIGNLCALSGVYGTEIGRKTGNSDMHAIFRPALFEQFATDFSFLASHGGPYDVERYEGETLRDIADWFVGDELGSGWRLTSAAGLPSRATPTGWSYDSMAMAYELEHRTGSRVFDPRVDLRRYPDKRLELGFYVAVYFPS